MSGEASEQGAQTGVKDEYKVSTPRCDGPEQFPADPTIKTGPPPPTYCQERMTVELVNVTKTVSVRLANQKILEANYAKLNETLMSCFMGKKIMPAYEEINIGDHFMGMWNSGSGITLKRLRVTEKLGPNAQIKGIDVDRDEPVECWFYNMYNLTVEAIKFSKQLFQIEIDGLGLLNNTVYLKKCIDKIPNVFVIKTKMNKQVPVVELFDANDANRSLTSEIMSHVSTIFAVNPPAVDVLTSCILSDFTTEGIVCYNYSKTVLNAIAFFLTNFNPQKHEKHEKEFFVKDVVVGSKVYLARFDDQYSRVKVIETLSKEKVRVEYLDYGNVETVPVSDLVDAELVEKLLQVIPPQCLRGQLSGIGFVKDTDSFWNLAHDTEIFLLKIDEDGKLPKISLFIPNEEGKPGTSINETLLSNGQAFLVKPKTLEKAAPKSPSSTPITVEPLPSGKEPKHLETVGKNGPLEDKASAEFGGVAFTDLEFNLAQFLFPSPPDPETIKKQNKVGIFKIISAFGEDDIALQIQNEEVDYFPKIEANLNDYCDMMVAQSELRNTEIQKDEWYALYCSELKKWVRCSVIDLHDEEDGKHGRMTFGALDYGFWSTVRLEHNNNCISDKVQVLSLPPVFKAIPPQGVTASQSYNPILNTPVPVDTLRRLKNCLIQVWINEYISEKFRHIPHVKVTIIKVLTSPTVTGRPSRILRRKSI